MTDFDAALRAGMALTIDIPATVTEVLRLVVVGARGTVDPNATKLELERLFDAHHFTRGLALLAPGTPTNSIPGERPAYTSKPGFDDVFAIEHRRLLVGGASSPLCKPRDSSDGTRLAEFLGIDSATFAYVPLADGTSRVDGAGLRLILRAALERRLTQQLDGILDGPALQEALSFAVEWVNPMGPLPPFRVGAQPYGVLPILLRGTRPPATGTMADDFLPILDRLRNKIWTPAAAKLDWVGQPNVDPASTLISILQQDAVARQILVRPFLGRQLANRLAAQLDARAAADLGTSRASVAALLDSLGAANSRAAPIVDALHLPFAPVMTAPLVQQDDLDPLSNQCARVYLELVASLPLNVLARNAYGGDRPRPLLFAIARLAMLELADSRARELVGQIQPPPDRSLWDGEELPDWVANSGYDTPANRLEARDPLADFGTIAERLGDASPYPEAATLHSLRNILRVLRTRDPNYLEELLRGNFGVLSHRLDAWYTGLATVELSDLRANPQSKTGINVGAYGVVEHIMVAPRKQEAGKELFTSPVNGGFIHAPSANHAAAAAVMRSVHLGHAAAGHGDAFSVDLSSERVRRGIELLDGVRGGQPLGALIGYRVERALATEGQARYILPWRGAAPIVAHRLTPGTEAAETVAASNVVDGLELLELAGYDGTQHANMDRLSENARLPTFPNDRATLEALQRVLAQAEDMVDSVADLVLAESVFQAVQGNPLRAGAAVDSASGAHVAPTDPDIARTPRTGVATTHRLLVLLGEPKADTPSGGWASTPRALAEPRLEAWARMVLPDPREIRIRANFLDSADAGATEKLDITLASLHESTEQHYLRFGALDVVALADPHDTPHQTALEIRLAALIESAHSPRESDMTLQLVFEREAAWKDEDFGLVEVLEVARSIRDVIARSRGITPVDLCMPGEKPELVIDDDERTRRASAAVLELVRVDGLIDSVRKANTRPQLLREALFAADGLGIAGASPSSVRDSVDKEEQARQMAQLLAQASVVQVEIAARRKKLTLLTAGDSTGQLKSVFGESFAVLPVLTPSTIASNVFDQPPGGATQAAIRTWLSRAARVRAGAALLDTAFGYAESVAEVRETVSVQEFRVAQLAGPPGERWVGLEAIGGQTIPGGRVSVVAAIARAPDDVTLGGMLVDEWVEVVPSDSETTSVAFHYDGPSSTAPQTLLLGVPLTPLESWTVQTAYDVVVEALALAKLRLVDPDSLPEIGQVLPAFIAAENSAGDTIGLDVEVLTAEDGP